MTQPTFPPCEHTQSLPCIVTVTSQPGLPQCSFCELEELRAEVARLQNHVPGLSATLDEYGHFAGLVRQLLAEHDAAASMFNNGERPDDPITVRIRAALASLEPIRGEVGGPKLQSAIDLLRGERDTYRAALCDLVAELSRYADGALKSWSPFLRAREVLKSGKPAIVAPKPWRCKCSGPCGDNHPLADRCTLCQTARPDAAKEPA